MFSDDQLHRLMDQALASARAGIEQGELPFGCVVADASGRVFAAAHNTVHSAFDPTAHAELCAVRAATQRLQRSSLRGYAVISTCEPCPMCAAALVLAEVDAIYFGADLEDAAAAGMAELLIPICRTLSVARHRPTLRGGVLQGACRDLFQAVKATGRTAGVARP